MKVLAVTGASGGHIFPALSFLDALKIKDKEIDTLLVLPKRSIKNCVIPPGLKVGYISTSPVKLSFDFKNFIAILGFLKGSLESLIILIKFRPDIVVGFGSLDSVPLVLLAWFFRIKTLIHEQNVLPGRANRLLVRFSDRMAVSFAETEEFLKGFRKKIVLTGCPLRKELMPVEKSRALGFFGFGDNKFTILVMGGSLGSHRINMSFLGAISLVSDRSRFQVIHIAGAQDYDLLCKGYKDLNIAVKLFGFLKDMQYAYSACDIAVSRAGATTITELISFRIPAIIAPYPFAYKHQLDNAGVLERMGASVVIADDELDARRLKQALDDFSKSPDKINLMRSRYNNFPMPCANDLLAKEVAALASYNAN